MVTAYGYLLIISDLFPRTSSTEWGLEVIACTSIDIFVTFDYLYCYRKVITYTWFVIP